MDKEPATQSTNMVTRSVQKYSLEEKGELLRPAPDPKKIYSRKKKKKVELEQEVVEQIETLVVDTSVTEAVSSVDFKKKKDTAYISRIFSIY